MATDDIAARLSAVRVQVGSIWAIGGYFNGRSYDVRMVRRKFVAEMTIHHKLRREEVVEIGRYKTEQEAADACQKHYANTILEKLEVVDDGHAESF